MVSSHRRTDDPEGADYKGPRDASEVTAMWNGKGVSVKGGMAIFFLAVLAIIGSNLYAGWRVESAVVAIVEVSKKDHGVLRTSQDRTSCIVTMKSDEREKFRADYRPGAFKQWCPWVEE